jgi:hypothetical protein
VNIDNEIMFPAQLPPLDDDANEVQVEYNNCSITLIDCIDG